MERLGGEMVTRNWVVPEEESVPDILSSCESDKVPKRDWFGTHFFSIQLN